MLKITALVSILLASGRITCEPFLSPFVNFCELLSVSGDPKSFDWLKILYGNIAYFLSFLHHMRPAIVISAEGPKICCSSSRESKGGGDAVLILSLNL